MILVVDDDEDVRATISHALNTLAYRSVEAENGREAIEKLERIGADFAILDYLLPDMTGAELANELRKIKPELPIIFATGLGDDVVRSAVGPDASILYKPFRLGELAELVASALSEKGS